MASDSVNLESDRQVANGEKKSLATRRISWREARAPRSMVLKLAACLGIVALSMSPLALFASGDRAEAPLLENIGTYSRRLLSCSEEARPFFDQGLRLTYGFYFPEALASFREAARLDPECAMAHWGAALAIGPNPNSRYTQFRDDPEQAGLEAIRRARKLSEYASEKERAFIEALWKQYDETVVDRRTRDENYAEAMKGLFARFPDDPEAGTFYAAALMVLSPWDYFWPDGTPRPGISDAGRTLEEVMEKHPDHPGAIHYYIHLVENSQQPERALAPADRLEALMPQAGHIVHMPSHIYVRTGLYAKAIASNRRSLAADEVVVKAWGEHPLPIETTTYPLSATRHPVHAHDFLHMVAVLQGNYAEALQTAQVVMNIVRDSLEENGSAQRRFIRLWLTQKRFEKWQDILTTKSPETGQPFVDGMWHYVRGSALAATGDLDAARGELALTREAMREEGMNNLRTRRSSAKTILTLASHVLAGEIAAQGGRIRAALSHLETAVRLEDHLKYVEPPDWGHPVRHTLGRVLMEAGRFAEAETVYWENLRRYPENGWALHGLWKSLVAQEKPDRAAAVEQRFRKAWAHADSTPSTSNGF